MQFLKTYGTTEGPLGFPMLDQQAQALDEVLKRLPREPAFAYRKAQLFKAPTELMPGERSDVSWISTEDVDRVQEVVLARGMDESQFKLNPLVTLQHSYAQPPVGKSLWRKRVKDGALVGIKAKTQYPLRPDDWPLEEWIPDYAFSLVKADLLRGKSIGFLPTKVHAPTAAEISQRPAWADVRLVIDEWILLEYAVCFLPCQPNAVVEAVSKARGELPESLHQPLAHWLTKNGLRIPDPEPAGHRFLTLEELELALQRRIGAFDVEGFVEQHVRDAVERYRGRV